MRASWIALLFFSWQTVAVAGVSRNARKLQKYGVVIETMLDPSKYHKYIRPNIQLGRPVDVNVTLSVKSIDRISDDDMEYRITFTLLQRWRDARLDATKTLRGYSKTLTMSGSLVRRIWVPDTYIVNSHTSYIHDVTTRNGLIRLSPDGTLLYVLRITSKVSCPMNLRKYPMDQQVCRLVLESWSFPMADLVYRWNNDEVCGGLHGSVTGVEGVVLSRFNITKCAVHHAVTAGVLGNNSRLVFEFHLKRNMLFFMMQTYIPAVLLVVLSWISFWINRNSVPARVGLTATTVLSMTTHMIGVYNRGPESTSYIKAVDLYVCVCYGFVFIALVEYAAVHFALHFAEARGLLLSERAKEKSYRDDPEDNDQINMNQCESVSQGSAFTSIDETEFVKNRNEPRTARQPISHLMSGLKIFGNNRPRDHEIELRQRNSRERRSCSQKQCVGVNNKKCCCNCEILTRLDIYARVYFPVCFILFNIIYWWFYLGND